MKIIYNCILGDREREIGGTQPGQMLLIIATFNNALQFITTKCLHCINVHVTNLMCRLMDLCLQHDVFIHAGGTSSFFLVPHTDKTLDNKLVKVIQDIIPICRTSASILH